LARAWRWAVTWPPFLPVFLSFHFTPGSLPSQRPLDLILAHALRYCPFRIPVKMTKVSAASPLTQKPDQARRRFRLGMLVFFAMLAWALCTALNQPKLGLAMLFGVGFGLLIERAQICFTSAFRDMWITGRTMMAKAIIAGMAVSAIGIFSYVQLGVEPKIMWAGPNAVIGGLLFGFGIVLAGGCETGWMYRAVEGQVHYWWVGLGNVLAPRYWPISGMIYPRFWQPTGTRLTC
jgi:uncharacterized membrane protein YedE/YeeE